MYDEFKKRVEDLGYVVDSSAGIYIYTDSTFDYLAASIIGNYQVSLNIDDKNLLLVLFNYMITRNLTNPNYSLFNNSNFKKLTEINFLRELNNNGYVVNKLPNSFFIYEDPDLSKNTSFYFDPNDSHVSRKVIGCALNKHCFQMHIDDLQLLFSLLRYSLTPTTDR